MRRVVLTSAFHAVSWGHPHTGHVFTEADWTVLGGPGVDAYGKSKTIAERAAWEFVAGTPMELTTMLPVAVIRLAALLSAEFRPIVPDLGYVKLTSNEQAGTVLGWTPRKPEDAIVSSAKSMIAAGLVKT